MSKSDQEPNMDFVPDGNRAGRVLRIGALTLVVLGIEWRLADPHVLAQDADLWPVPYSMLCMLAPMALGLWAFEKTPDGYSGARLDALWAVVLGTLLYVVASILPQVS